ncbi:MAG TPA: hypothetical protein VK708_07595 [Bryobacteraceae bacterium]|nr:hypothetical protein [Bryobacteraceae bacterium]
MKRCTAILLCLHGLAFGQDALSLKARIPLPNVSGRIDHFSVDIQGQRLFVSAVANHTLEVIDLQSGRRVHTIPDLAEPQGVFYDASSNRLFVACGGDGTTKIYDGTSLQLLKTVKFPDDADNIRYDARTRRVVVGYAGAKSLRKRAQGEGALGFLDANGNEAGEIVLDAHPESFQLEKTGPRVFVNVPEKREIEVADVDQRAVLARWPVSAENNFPMALDEAHHRLLVGCWMPPELLVFDTGTGKQTASAEIDSHTDDLFYDASRSRVYVLATSGFIDVLQQKGADRYERIARYPTPPGTQTGLFVPEWGKLFAGVQGRSGQPSEILVYEAGSARTTPATSR